MGSGCRVAADAASDWLKFKNPEAPAVRREAEENWGAVTDLGSEVLSGVAPSRRPNNIRHVT